tara:strand:+ start:9715 stop:13521 length:3807 start_codon:yes stop_codon:yes gene_type:complete
MPEIKTNFLKGKMNQDLDERLIPKGEYREAQNLALSESEDSDAGALETFYGNVAKNINSNFKDYSGNLLWATTTPTFVIGYCNDIKNKRIFYFVTSFTEGSDTENIRLMPRALGAGANLTGGTAFNTNPRTGASPSLDQCAIIMYDIETNNTTVLVYGPWLNFTTKKQITGTAVIDDLLFWTDDYNPPRRINVDKALNNPTSRPQYYTCEEQVSLAKYAPYTPIRLVNKNGYWADSNTANADAAGDKRDTNIKSEYMKDKFLRFSYRYRFEDGEYSTMAPFTQVVFEPLNASVISNTENTANSTGAGGTTAEPTVDVSKHSIFRKTTVDIMQNSINKVVLRIPMPNLDERNDSADYSAGGYANSYDIDAVDILIKESDGLAIRVVKTIKLAEVPDADFEEYTIKPNSSATTYDRQALKYIYQSEEPYKVLPEDQLTRVYDQVPLRAKSLEIVGNRVVFGNYLENYNYPTDYAGNRGMNYNVDDAPKGDAEFNAAQGLLQDTNRAYKYHSLKQRRTYQVGVVFADKYGRQSPVILSSSQLAISNSVFGADTVTVDPITADLSNTFSGAYSWSSNQVAIGRALKIIWNDQQLFQNDRQMYRGYETGNSTEGLHTNYNPYGWYSYKIVVKQAEQDYYNVYCSHPFDGWDNIKDVSDTNRDAGKSFLSLYGDNINKVPRSLNDTDLNRQGVAGSDAKLYPKVVMLGGTTTGESAMNQSLQEPVNVITLGDAFEQNLYMSGDDNASGTGGFSVYNFVYGKDRNPLIAEIPNMKRFHSSGSGNSTIAEYWLKLNSGTHGGGSHEKSLILRLDTDQDPSNSEGTIQSNDYFNNWSINATNISFDSDNKTVDIDDYVASNNANDLTLSSKQKFNAGDRLLLSKYQEGLSVFETEPFNSKIDIYYETGTCGLVQDLNDELSDTTVANAPTNAAITDTSFNECETVGTPITTISATDNAAPSNLSYSISSAQDGNGTPIQNKFSCNATTGVVTLAGGFRHTGTTRDNCTINFAINDPNSSTIYESFNMTVNNCVPTFTNNSTAVAIPFNVGAGVDIYTDNDVTNGASLGNEDHIGTSSGNNMAVSHTIQADEDVSAGYKYFYWMFDVNVVGNTLTVTTTSMAFQLYPASNTLTNLQWFFNTHSAAERTMTITLDDGMSANNTASMTLQINEAAASVVGTLDTTTAVCDPCEATPQTFYAIANGHATVPYVESGELRVFGDSSTGNKVYTNSSLTTTASAGTYLYQRTQDEPGFRCVTIDTNGVVVSESDTDECNDYES